MKTIYIDCSSGISGDMMLGALVDLGVDGRQILSSLKTLPIGDFSLSWERTFRRGISATWAKVDVPKQHHHRGLADILKIIDESDISIRAKELSSRIFTRLAKAEAKVHGSDIESVHFHEVGAVDAIVDIVGTAVALDLLGELKIIGSPVRTGFGSVHCAHGDYPVPAPGTAALLKGVPAYAGEAEGEWTTPTGAAILTALCESYGPMPTMSIEEIGYGAGSREHESIPNLLRLLLGETSAATKQEVMVIETQLDDMDPEIFSHLSDLLSKSGALDWYITPVQMKKNRPGQLLTIFCRQEAREEIASLLFSETTTIGLRYYTAAREELEREFVTVKTELGEVKIKVAKHMGKVMNAAPEYDDCRKLAEQTGTPLKRIRELAMKAWLEMKADID